MKKLLSVAVSAAIVALSAVFPLTAGAESATGYNPANASDFDVYNNSKNRPSFSAGEITTVGGATKMLAMSEPIQMTEKNFDGLYDRASYDLYGNDEYTMANYGMTFEDGKISTRSVRGKMKLNGTATMTDFTAAFTIFKVQNGQGMYGGAAFRLQDDDFRNDTFGTKGYMLLLTASNGSKDVKVSLRNYKTSATQVAVGTAKTFTGLLNDSADAVGVTLSVTGKKVDVTVFDATAGGTPQSVSFTLPDESGTVEYYQNGSFAYVVNGSHEFTNLSLRGKVCANTATFEKPLYGMLDAANYTVYGKSTLANYGVSFKTDRISTASQSKIKYGHYTSIEDFKADFKITKTNGNSMYGGIGFRIQDGDFTNGTFGTAGYLLYAYSAAASMDVKLILRNYSKATSYVETTIATIEGLLAAPTDGIRFEVTVKGFEAEVMVHDALFDERSKTVDFSLYSDNAKAGNYSGGSIAFVSNGTHDYTDLSVSELKETYPYLQVENFETSADFTLPDVTNLQGGLTFYATDANNMSPGLSGYAINLVRTTNTADSALAVQLLRYGMKNDGTESVNLGAIATNTTTSFLTSANGAGDVIRLHIRVVRGNITYSVENLTNGKASKIFQNKTSNASTSNSVVYTTVYDRGGIGYFTNCAAIKLNHLQVTPLCDCTVSFETATGGTATGDGVYSYGDSVTLKAHPQNGYCFVGWRDGESIISTDEQYSFTVTQDKVFAPVFKLLPVRIIGYDAESGCVIVSVEDVAGVGSVGCEISVITENNTVDQTLSTTFADETVKDQQPWIVTDSGVYYCDVSGNGEIDADDMTAIRRKLLTDSAAYLNTADTNADGQLNVIDLIRMKKVFAEKEYDLSSYIVNYSYPFKCGLPATDEKFYVRMTPFAVSSNTAYGAPLCLTFEDGEAVRESTLSHHTPFGAVRIACVGDSITQGVGATNWSTGDQSYAYPARLQRLLGDGAAVANFGKGSSYVYYKAGRTEDLWYPNTEEYVRSNEFDADIVVIKLGTNDARAVLDETAAEAWKAQFTDLIEHYQSLPGCPKVYVVSCLTMKPYNEDLETSLVNYILPRQRAVAESLGCEYIDAYTELYDYFVSGNGFASDNLHPNDDGYETLANLIADNISLDIFF